MASLNLEDSIFWLDFPASFLGLARARCIREERHFKFPHFAFCVLILSGQIILRAYFALEILEHFCAYVDDEESTNKTIILVELLIIASELCLNLTSAIFVIFKTKTFVGHLGLIQREAKRIGCVDEVKNCLKISTINCALFVYGSFTLYMVERCIKSFGKWSLFFNGIFLAMHMLTFALFKFKVSLVMNCLTNLFRTINESVMTVHTVDQLQELRKSHLNVCGAISKINLLFQNVLLASEASEFVLIVYYVYMIMMLVLDIEKSLYADRVKVILRSVLFLLFMAVNYLNFSTACEHVLSEVTIYNI
jgi:hypothetical protein